MSVLSNNDKSILDKMLSENNVEDLTHEIRTKSHSKLIRNDIKQFILLETKYLRLKQTNHKQFENICAKHCSFLYDNYNTIYTKLLSNKLDLNIFDKFLIILQKIEIGELNQHEGAYLVGKYLKEIYIDNRSKNKENEANEENEATNKLNIEKNITYKQFKYLDH